MLGAVGATWALTARGAILERLGRAVADGELGGVLLTGPAGVGKTRLGDEALRAVPGMPTARVVGHEATRAIPLGAVAHLLPPSLVQDVGMGEEDRARLFHRARLGLVEAAGGDRLLLLLDDVDQLDDTTLAVLLPLTQDRVLFLVATIRSGRSLPGVFDSLVKDGHLDVWEVPPLAQDEVTTLLHRVLDGPVDGASVERLMAASSGNLQTLREVVRRAREDGLLERVDGAWRLSAVPIPTQLEELVASHLAEADEADRGVVEILAVAGSVGVADLEEIIDRDRLEALEARGFISVSIDRRRVRAALAHPLYGEVLRLQMSALRTLRLQRDLADRLEARGARRREDVTQLALWRLEAGGDIDAMALLRAGGLALAARDATLAGRFAVAAADRGLPYAAARMSVEAALLVADTDAAERAAAAVWDDPDLPDEQRAHMCRRLALARFAGRDLDGALDLVDDAAARIVDPSARNLVLAQRILLLVNRGLIHLAVDALDEMEPTDDPGLRSDLASARSMSLTMLGQFDASVVSAHDGREAQRRLPAWSARGGSINHIINEAHALLYSGRLDEARALARTSLATSRATGARGATVWLEIVHGEIERDAGYGRETLTHFAAAAELAPAARQDGALMFALAGVTLGHLLLGDVTAAAVALERADAAGDSPQAGVQALRERARAWLMAARGDLAGARTLLADVAEAPRRDGLWVAEVLLRHDIARFGGADAVVDRLAELAGLMEGPMVRLAAQQARAAAEGDPALLGAVVDGFERAGYPLSAAESAAEAAELHRRRGDPRAAAALERQVARLVDLTGARTPGLLRGRGVEPLTEREREIALMAAGGAPSKEIAAQLFLSARTVDTHLARSYRKLGINGRNELAAALDPSAT